PLLDGSRAQIILAIRRGGQPLAGVSIKGSAGGGLVTYDEGPGSYSSLATATGAAGGIVILNAQAPPGGAGPSIRLVDAAAVPVTFVVPAATGVATIAAVAL